MIAAIYIRVSTEGQVSEGFSVSAQINEIQQYCLKNNVEIYKVYKDEGISGTKEERPAFQGMIKDAEKGLFNLILVHKFDRFARKIELSHKIKAQLKKSKVNVISITEPIEDSPIGFFQEGLLELLAEYFIKNLSKEVKKGLVERASQGLQTGMMPYGYGSKNKEVYVIEEESKIVRLIFDLYIQKGFGYGRIAKYLNRNSIPTRMGKRWGHYQVDRIIQNVKYSGWISHAEQIYESQLPRIIDRDTFLTAQSLRTNKDTPAISYRSNNYVKFLLLGICRCGECKHVFKIWNNKDRRYYSCNQTAMCYGKDKCSHTKMYRAEELETAIINQLAKVLENTNIRLAVIKSEPICDTLQITKSKLESELSRAKIAYLEKAFTLEEYKEIKLRIEKELQLIKNIPTDVPENQNFLREKLKNVLEEFKAIPLDNIIERKNCLKRLIHQILIYKNKIEIEFQS